MLYPTDIGPCRAVNDDGSAEPLASAPLSEVKMISVLSYSPTDLRWSNNRPK